LFQRLKSKPVDLAALRGGVMFTSEELKETYRRLAEPFPAEAIERTKAAVTHKGYDTSGIKYQFIVNRLNEVLGLGGFRVERTFTLRERQARSGQPMFEATCDLIMRLGQWESGQFVPFAEATGTGGHTAASEADAKKGSLTNALKKVAAMFGCGWQAYAGTLDDDNVPAALHTEQQDLRKNGNGNGRPSNGKSGGNGRITTMQLERLRTLVADVGGDWGRYRDHVRGEHKVNVEYADRRLADQLIASLMATVEKRKSNGGHPSGRPQ